jgi:5'-nucleotidase
MTDLDCPNQLPGSCDISLPPEIRKCLQPIENTNLYELATNNYLAQGGSGFRTLQRNTTQLDTKIAQRDALIDFIRQGRPCGYNASIVGNDPAHGTTPDGLKPCAVDSDCADQGDFICQCVGNVKESGSGTTATCASINACDPQVGRCVLRACRDGVAGFHDRLCSDSTNAQQCESDLNSCELAGEECKQIACVDANLGATTDNRVEMIGR